MGLRKSPFQLHHTRRACLGNVGRVAEHLEGVGDVGLVQRALLRLVLVKVVVAIGQAEAALHDLQQRVCRVLVVGSLVDCKERVDAISRLKRRDGCGPVGARVVTNGQDGGKRREARRLDGIFVDGARPEGSDLVLHGIRGHLGLGQLLKELLQPPEIGVVRAVNVFAGYSPGLDCCPANCHWRAREVVRRACFHVQGVGVEVSVASPHGS